jgi:hypothetical protein
MARNDPQLNLRLPAELKQQLEVAAKVNNRTVTAETVARLQRTFADEPGVMDPNEFHYKLTGDGGAIFTLNADDLVERIADVLKSKFTGVNADKELQAFHQGFTKGLGSPVAPTVESKPKANPSRISRAKKK